MCTHACDDGGHHCLACMASGYKQLMHNALRNTVYRYDLTWNQLDYYLLPSDPQLRPADVLIMTTPSIVAPSWRQFPRLTFDFAIVSLYLATNLATLASVELSAANSYAKRKFDLKDCGTNCGKRCEAMNVGYEPIVFEVTGGLALEGQRHLQMICEALDTK